MISELTCPFNGQLSFPWITDLTDPAQASVFIVGFNQAKTFDAGRLSHERHLNRLFNRRGETARVIYDEIVGGKASPTRRNTDALRACLRRSGVEDVLETSVVCYSTPMSRDLGYLPHAGGRARGTEIFQTLLHFVKPRATQPGLTVSAAAGPRSPRT